MKIAFVSSEVFPYSKTGGLADIAGSLTKRLSETGCTVKVFSPKYDQVDEQKFGLKYCDDLGEMLIRIAGHIRPVHVYRSSVKTSEKDVELYFIDCPHYFYRDRIYTNDPDEDERFILFSKAVIESLQKLQWAPDVIHCNDWHTGLIPLYIKDNYSRNRMFDNTASLFTIHNIAYQGRFDRSTMSKAEIRDSLFFPGGPVEYYNDFSFLKTGIVFSDLINTVSKTYAQEILTTEYGAGLDGVLRDRRSDLFGIINGVDYNEWNPQNDVHLPYHYSPEDLRGKLKNKKFLLQHFSLPFYKDIPLVGIVSRLAGQKGFDIISEASSRLMQLNVQWIILGSGEAEYEDFFLDLAKSYPEKAAVYIGFNNELSH
ncbi:MAG: glycogen synthase, partial [Ignavibacteria bacterium]